MVAGSFDVAAPYVWHPKDPSVTEERRVGVTLLLAGRTVAQVLAAYSGVQGAGVTVMWDTLTVLLSGGIDGQIGRVELTVLCTDGSGFPVVLLVPIIAQLTLAGGDTVPITQATTTTGLTGGVLGPLPVVAPSGASVNVSGTAIARNLGTGDTISYNIMLTAKGFGTGGAVIALANTTPFEVDAAMAACTLTPTINGSFLMFAVVGLNAATIAWSCTVDVGVA